MGTTPWLWGIASPDHSWLGRLVTTDCPCFLEASGRRGLGAGIRESLLRRRLAFWRFQGQVGDEAGAAFTGS